LNFFCAKNCRVHTDEVMCMHPYDSLCWFTHPISLLRLFDLCSPHISLMCCIFWPTIIAPVLIYRLLFLVVTLNSTV
jgi:hypothetical protein